MNTLILKFRKAIGILIVSLVCTQYAAAQSQQEGLGLPGDNLNLSAVLDVFQQSKTLEEFESSINSENNKINNLDLNYDGRIDYIKVKDYPDGNLHSIVLQIDVNMNESQDVAVIYTEKRNNGNVDIQIVGDEDLYGKNYVIDLGNNQNTNTPNPGYNGGMMYDDNYGYNNYVAPSNWNIIVYMYSPSYSMWHSPWYWGYYPRRWNAWSPFYWNDYYNHCYHNYGWYSHNYYYGNRNRFRNHHSNWYGRNRHRSNVYHNNRQRGVYAKSYQGRPPVRKPIVGKPVAVTQNIRNVDNRVNSPGNRLDRNKTVSPQVNRVDRVQMQNQRNAKPQETQAAPLRKVENQRIQENNRQQTKPQIQEVRPQQQQRIQEVQRPQQQQPRVQEVQRPQQQPRRIQEVQRPQQQPRIQEVQRPQQQQPRQQEARPQPQRRQEISRPEPRPQMSRPEPRPVSNPTPRATPQQSSPRNDNPSRSVRPQR